MIVKDLMKCYVTRKNHVIIIEGTPFYHLLNDMKLRGY